MFGRDYALKAAVAIDQCGKELTMSHPSHSKLVEVWNPEQKSFYTACLLDIDEGLSSSHPIS
jgi:hypothetical protein